MERIIITHKYMDGKHDIVEKINKALEPYQIQITLREITLREYDDNRVYRTEERARDVRIDGCTMRGDAALSYL